MCLLHEIQASILDETVGVGSILLKLRFLASKLDADILEEWVQHETEGYPDGVKIPEYRTTQITYTGTFVDRFRQLDKVSISGYLIEEIAGADWVKYEIRDGLPVIDGELKDTKPGTQYGIDASNLKLLLQDKIYKGMAIVEINSRIDQGAFARIQHAVRAKTLDFVLKLEKQVPAAANVVVGKNADGITSSEQEDVKQLTQQIFYGQVTNIHADSGALITLNVAQGDAGSLLTALKSHGIPENEAEELIKLVVNETPLDDKEPIGNLAQDWIKEKLRTGSSEIWGVGKAIGRQIITEALKQYYGLK